MKAKAIVIALVVAAGIAFIVFGRGGSEKPMLAQAVAVGFPAPDVGLKDMEGNSWRLSSNKGNVVLLNFWATWCQTCKDEMPSLQKLYDAKKGDPRFKMVTVLYNDDPAAGLKYMEENNYNLPLYVDADGSAARAYGLTGVPETYISDKGGIMRKKFIGPADFDSPDAMAFFTRLLEEGS